MSDTFHHMMVLYLKYMKLLRKKKLTLTHTRKLMNPCASTHTHTHTISQLHLYIYIYIKRERERERRTDLDNKGRDRDRNIENDIIKKALEKIAADIWM